MVQVFQNFQAFDNNESVDFEVAHLKLWVLFLTRIKNIIFFSHELSPLFYVSKIFFFFFFLNQELY